MKLTTIVALLAAGCVPPPGDTPGSTSEIADGSNTGGPGSPGGPGGPGVTPGDDGGAPPDLMPAPLVVTQPTLLLSGTALYPRLIKLGVGKNAGLIVASVVTPLPSGRMGGTILRSSDDGLSFAEVGHIDDAVTSTGLCCATLYELPAAVGKLAAGTLLWAASVGGDTPGKPMSLIAWSSSDAGTTWTRLTTIVTAGVNRSGGGLWEPEFSQLADGTLVCHYSDETDPAHSQKLVELRSSDGVSFGQLTNTVATTAKAGRPGMANVRRLPNGTYVMTYEVCGVDACNAHMRTSTDGWSWGNANDIGPRPTTVDGKHFAHAPTVVWSGSPGNGRFYLVGQMVYDGAGNVAPENGSVVFANTEGGNFNWYEVAAPVPIKAPYDNFCPNYSSSLVPLDGGQIGLELATQWDGNVCRAYFARGRLLGSGDAAGVNDNGTYRLVGVMSGLCLDVSGGSAAAGTHIQQWTCNNLAPQSWTFSAAPDGSFSLRAQNSGLCLAVIGGATNPGAGLEQQPCNGGAAQAWNLRNVGAGYYTLGHPGGPVCLDDSGGSTAAGNPMEIWTCNDLSPQIWHLEPR